MRDSHTRVDNNNYVSSSYHTHNDNSSVKVVSSPNYKSNLTVNANSSHAQIINSPV